MPAALARMHAGTAPHSAAQTFYFSPLKLYEYMAAGQPVVASRVGDLAAIVEAAGGGVTVPPDRPDLLAAVLARLAEPWPLKIVIDHVVPVGAADAPAPGSRPSTR